MGTKTLLRSGAIGLVGVVAVGGAGLTGASGLPAKASGVCGPTYGYVEAVSATVSNGAVLVHGKRATLHCGGPDDSSYRTHERITVTMTPSATAVVWKKPADPSAGTLTIAASKLPTWLKRNRSEPIYRIHGPKTASTQLVEQWHP